MSTVAGQNASTSFAGGSAGLATGNVADFGAIYLNTVAVITSSATLTAGAIETEGSLDGLVWYPLRASITAATDFTTVVTKVYNQSVPCRFMRSRISTAITGGTISATIGAAGV